MTILMILLPTLFLSFVILASFGICLYYKKQPLYALVFLEIIYLSAVVLLAVLLNSGSVIHATHILLALVISACESIFFLVVLNIMSSELEEKDKKVESKSFDVGISSVSINNE